MSGEVKNAIKTTQIDGDLSVGRNVSAGGDATIQGAAHLKGNLRVDGWLDAKNIKGANKGLFMTVERLNEAYPFPQKGWYALVGATLPAPVYVSENGSWVPTGETGVGPDMVYYNKLEIDDKFAAQKEEIDNLSESIDDTNTNVAEVQSAIDEELRPGLADVRKQLGKVLPSGVSMLDNIPSENLEFWAITGDDPLAYELTDGQRHHLFNPKSTFSDPSFQFRTKQVVIKNSPNQVLFRPTHLLIEVKDPSCSGGQIVLSYWNTGSGNTGGSLDDTVYWETLHPGKNVIYIGDRFSTFGNWQKDYRFYLDFGTPFGVYVDRIQVFGDSSEADFSNDRLVGVNGDGDVYFNSGLIVDVGQTLEWGREPETSYQLTNKRHIDNRIKKMRPMGEVFTAELAIDQIRTNISVMGDEVLRDVLNPFSPISNLCISFPQGDMLTIYPMGRLKFKPTFAVFFHRGTARKMTVLTGASQYGEQDVFYKEFEIAEGWNTLDVTDMPVVFDGVLHPETGTHKCVRFRTDNGDANLYKFFIYGEPLPDGSEKGYTADKYFVKKDDMLLPAFYRSVPSSPEFQKNCNYYLSLAEPVSFYMPYSGIMGQEVHIYNTGTGDITATTSRGTGITPYFVDLRDKSQSSRSLTVPPGHEARCIRCGDSWLYTMDASE